MTATLVAPAWVKVTLDTTPPVVAVTAPAQVEPGEPWVVRLQANEDLGPCSAYYTDEMEFTRSVGVQVLGPRTLLVTMPTDTLLSGTLLVLVRDTACNEARVAVPLHIRRPQPFLAALTVGHAFDTTLTLDHAFDTTLAVEHGLDATLEITDAE